MSHGHFLRKLSYKNTQTDTLHYSGLKRIGSPTEGPKRTLAAFAAGAAVDVSLGKYALITT